MKIILIKDVKGLGIDGDIKDVSDGYGRNFLVPRKLAVVATSQNTTIWEKKNKQRDDRATRDKEEKLAQLSKLKDLTIAFTVDVGEGGKLFGSVTSTDIADALRTNVGVDVDKRDIELPEHIKRVGNYEASIKLHPEVHAKIKIEVVGKEQG